MGKFSEVVICSDLDGTLSVGGVVSDRNRRAIEYFISEGGELVLVTGRDFDYSARICASLGLTSLVGCLNGTRICELDSGRAIYNEVLPEGAEIDILRAINALGDIIVDVNVFYSQRQKENIAPDSKNIGDRAFWEGAQKVLFHSCRHLDLHDVARLKSVLGEKYTVSRSWPRGIEINSAKCNKGIAAQIIKRRLGKKILVCVGDYENDLEMIKAADVSFVPQNALDELKDFADAVVCDALYGTVAEVIDILPEYIKQ